MFGVSTYLMFTVLVSMQPPEGPALPRYDEAPPPVVAPEPSAPPAPVPLSPERAKRFREIGRELTIAGAIVLPIGIAGFGVAISGVVAQANPTYGPGFLEREDRAILRESIGLGVGISCTAIGIALLTVGSGMRSQARASLKAHVAVSPTWLWGGGGVAVGGRF